MKKSVLISIFCLAAHFAFGTNITVSSDAALAAAVNGTADTIYINGTIVTSAQITINRNIVFIGKNNATLDGNNSHFIFYINANSQSIRAVKFLDLIFINGNTLIYSSLRNGAAICAEKIDSLKVKNCKFMNNQSNNGGAIYGEGIKYFSIENSEFTNNKAAWGGAFYGIDINYLLLYNCKFNTNSTFTGGFGGAIWTAGTSSQYGHAGSFYIINCLFDNNKGTQGTGALDTHNWSKVTIFNSVFTNNFAGSQDPATICVGNNSQTNFINCTIAKNRSNGNVCGIGLWGAEHVNIYNCVLAGNSATNGMCDIGYTPNNYSSSTVKMYNSAYQKIANSVTLSTNVNNFNNIVPTNIFADFANNDFHLLNGAVAINSGNENDYITQWNSNFPNNIITSASAHNDLDGHNRRICIIDMGAYESDYPVIVPFSDTFCENSFYNFKNRILNQEGIYYDTIKNAGCDTIIKLTLTKLIVPRYSYRDTSYKCEWYYFGGDSINKTGIYVDTLVARNGCDSIVTVDLLVRPREFNDTLNICIDRLPYKIYDTIFSPTALSGTYIIHHRCAIITLLLNVLSKPQALPPDIPKICAGDNNFILKFPNSNEKNTKPPTNFDILFDNKALTAGFVNQSGVLNNNEIVVQIPEKVFPDNYNFTITLKDNLYNCASQTLDIQFPVLYPDSIMAQKWDDVIALKNANYNGGFDFAAYQWYKNGSIMTGETYSYIYLNGEKLQLGDKYSVLITRSDGSQMFSCDFDVQPPHPQLTTRAYVVQNGNTLIIYTSENATVYFYTLTGVMLQSTYVSAPQQTISAPISGAYILEIIPVNQTQNRTVLPIIIK